MHAWVDLIQTICESVKCELIMICIHCMYGVCVYVCVCVCVCVG